MLAEALDRQSLPYGVRRRAVVNLRENFNSARAYRNRSVVHIRRSTQAHVQPRHYDSWRVLTQPESPCLSITMTKSGYILSLDQGTTGTTAMLIDSTGAPLWTVSREIRQIHPRPGWVEHDPRELFESCLETTEELLEMSEMHPRSIVAIGITNQRETLVMWDRRTGEPVANAIVWQCRRSAPICERLKSEGLEETVRSKTGLPIDPYFTGAKIRWLLDNIPDGQRRAQHGDLACGTVDSWLVWNLTNKLIHATDATNASRTMLFDIDAMRWDSELLSALDIPAAILPEVRSSSEIYGYVSGDLSSGQPIPIAGIAGDQQASLFGQACFEPGSAKNTYGTGCFVLTNTGTRRVESTAGLISTVAWTLGGETTYALEGSIFSAGSTIQWLRDGLGLISEAAESEDLALQVPDNGGVYLVPAFYGLGAPYWDAYARGAVIGLSGGTNKAHIARAALESIAYQTRDVLEAMRQDAGIDPARSGSMAARPPTTFSCSSRRTFLGFRSSAPP